MKFKDYGHRFFSDFLRPTNRQITYQDFTNNPKFKDLLENQCRATLIRLNKQVVAGLMSLYGNKLLFCAKFDSKLQAVAGELMLISLEHEGQTYYCQTKFDSIQKNPNGLSYELTLVAPLSSRFYKRFDLQAGVVVNEVPTQVVDRLLMGDHKLRRYRGRRDKNSTEFTICEDFLADSKNQTLWHMVQQTAPLITAKMVNISQGGCLVSLDAESAEHISDLNHDTTIFVQTSLRWGKLSSSVRSFAQVKKHRQFNHSLQLHCAFLDHLPRIPQRLKYLEHEYTFRFGEAVNLRVNNSQSVSLAHEAVVSLPMAIHDIEVTWSNGRVTSERLDLRNYSNHVVDFKSNLADGEN